MSSASVVHSNVKSIAKRFMGELYVKHESSCTTPELAPHTCEVSLELKIMTWNIHRTPEDDTFIDIIISKIGDCDLVFLQEATKETVKRIWKKSEHIWGYAFNPMTELAVLYTSRIDVSHIEKHAFNFGVSRDAFYKRKRRCCKQLKIEVRCARTRSGEEATKLKFLARNVHLHAAYGTNVQRMGLAKSFERCFQEECLFVVGDFGEVAEVNVNGVDILEAVPIRS